MTRRVDDVDLHVIVEDRCILGKNRNTALALQIPRIHDALCHLLIRAENMALPQHGVNQRRLSMVDVGDDRDIPQLFIYTHFCPMSS